MTAVQKAFQIRSWATYTHPSATFPDAVDVAAGLHCHQLSLVADAGSSLLSDGSQTAQAGSITPLTKAGRRMRSHAAAALG